MPRCLVRSWSKSSVEGAYLGDTLETPAKYHERCDRVQIHGHLRERTASKDGQYAINPRNLVEQREQRDDHYACREQPQ